MIRWPLLFQPRHQLSTSSNIWFYRSTSYLRLNEQYLTFESPYRQTWRKNQDPSGQQEYTHWPNASQSTTICMQIRSSKEPNCTHSNQAIYQELNADWTTFMLKEISKQKQQHRYTTGCIVWPSCSSYMKCTCAEATEGTGTWKLNNSLLDNLDYINKGKYIFT